MVMGMLGLMKGEIKWLIRAWHLMYFVYKEYDGGQTKMTNMGGRGKGETQGAITNRKAPLPPKGLYI